MLFNFLAAVASISSMTAIFQGQPFWALAIAVAGIVLCLIEIHHRDRGASHE